MSLSVFYVRNESSSGGCVHRDTSFCNGGVVSRSHCVTTVASCGDFPVLVAACVL